jgi:hypothetical protein
LPALDVPRHYVYQLVDSRTGLPFYAGKGQNRRAWQHEESVRLNRPVCNARKTQRIREIIAAGASVCVQVLADYTSELDALAHVAELISDDPTLTNANSGIDVLGPHRPHKSRVVRTVRRRDKVVSPRQFAGRKFLGLTLGLTEDPSERAESEIQDWLDGLFNRRGPHWSRRKRRWEDRSVIPVPRELSRLVTGLDRKLTT